MKGTRAFKHEYVAEVRFYLGPNVAPQELAQAIMRGVSTRAFHIPGMCKVESVKRVGDDALPRKPSPLIGPSGT